MHCCTGNGSRALYYLWENMLEYNDGQLQLHLLLNRKSPWVEVNSHIPYNGNVEMKVKAQCESVAVSSTRMGRNFEQRNFMPSQRASPRKLNWKGRYVNFGEASPGRYG